MPVAASYGTLHIGHLFRSGAHTTQSFMCLHASIIISGLLSMHTTQTFPSPSSAATGCAASAGAAGGASRSAPQVQQCVRFPKFSSPLHFGAVHSQSPGRWSGFGAGRARATTVGLSAVEAVSCIVTGREPGPGGESRLGAKHLRQLRLQPNW